MLMRLTYWKNIGENNYLFNVRQLSATFQGKFLDELKRMLRKAGNLQGFNSNIQKAYRTNWVVYSEAPMTNIKNLIGYLGQYTHKVAISNQRIIDIKHNEVLFFAKDYRDNATVKKTKLSGKEFLRRFVQHILPKGFVRIRRYGIYNPTVKKNLDLQFSHADSPFEQAVAKKNEAEVSNLSETRDSSQTKHICPFCKKGNMVVINVIPRIRSPSGHLPTILLSFLK